MRWYWVIGWETNKPRERIPHPRTATTDHLLLEDEEMSVLFVREEGKGDGAEAPFG